jgi:hypothetical protein
VAAGAKCLFVVGDSEEQFGWAKAADQCRVKGGRPAVANTPQEMGHVLKLFHLLKYTPKHIYLGLTFHWSATLPIYR